MAQQQVSHVLARLKRKPAADFAVDAQLNQALAEQWNDDGGFGIVRRRERLLTPLVTLRLFLTQILHGNVAITALRQLSGIDFAKSSYSEARDRLQLSALQSLLAHLHAQAMGVLRIVPKLSGGGDDPAGTGARRAS